MKENALKLAAKLEEISGGLRGNELIFDLSGLGPDVMTSFIKKNKFKLVNKDKHGLFRYSTYKGPDGTILKVNWSDGYAKVLVE